MWPPLSAEPPGARWDTRGVTLAISCLSVCLSVSSAFWFKVSDPVPDHALARGPLPRARPRQRLPQLPLERPCVEGPLGGGQHVHCGAGVVVVPRLREDIQ